MIALDKWRWMPLRQAGKLSEVGRGREAGRGAVSKWVEINHRKAAARKQLGHQDSGLAPRTKRTSADLRSTLVNIMAVLNATLASLPGTHWYQAYDCSNSSNPVEMYSLLDP
jgi:hypothetical protein